jgi:hypothetical protein
VLLLFRAFYYFAHAKSWLRQNAHRDVIHAKMHSPTWCHLYFTHIYYFISFNWFYHFSMTKMSLSLFSSSHGDDSHGGSHHTLCHFSALPCPRTSEMHRRMHAVAAHTLPPRSCHARVPLLHAVAVRLTRLQSGGVAGGRGRGGGAGILGSGLAEGDRDQEATNMHVLWIDAIWG